MTTWQETKERARETYEVAKDAAIQKAAEIERKPPIWALVLFAVIAVVLITALRMAIK